MNKPSLTYIALSLILAINFVSGCNPDNEEPVENGMSAHLTLNMVDELTWRDVCRILEPLTEVGYTSIQINNFCWVQYCGCRLCRSNDGGNPPPITLSKSEGENYDFQGMDDWCSTNSSIHAVITFGDQVGFYDLEQTTQILHKYKMTFDIKKTGDNPSTTIRIEKDKGDVPN